jgi:hypothetical protein
MSDARAAFALLVAAVTVGSSAHAHSWSWGTVIGRLDPTSIHCENDRCSATLRGARVTAFGASAVDASEVAIGVDPSAALVDRAASERWTQPRAALVAAAGRRVRVSGRLDGSPRGPVIAATRVVRLGPDAPSASAGKHPVFPGCAKPPWTPDETSRCISMRTRVRRVAVHAVVESDAFFEDPSRPSAGAVLPIEILSVKGGAEALDPPDTREIALVSGSAKLVDPTNRRTSVRGLRAGDTVTLRGHYRAPDPIGVSPQWPILVIDEAVVVQRTQEPVGG